MSLLPRSLVGRVLALYTAALGLIVVTGLGLVLSKQFDSLVKAAGDDARILISVLSPVVLESAVIGDYDAIQRHLARSAGHSGIARLVFTDGRGVTLQEGQAPAARHAPDWLVWRLAARLPGAQQPIEAGGTAYGRLRLESDAPAVADQVWRDGLVALGLAAAGLALGVVLVYRPLVHWLGHLDRIGELDAGLAGGDDLARRALAAGAPTELRKTFEVLGRAASSLQSQRERATATLAAIDDAVFTCNAAGLVTLVNDAACRLTGLPAERLAGQHLLALMPALVQTGSAMQPLQGRWQHRRLLWTAPDGGQRMLDANLSPIVDADGGSIGHVLACRDMTEQHRLDQDLRAGNTQRAAALAAMRQLLERSPIADTPVAGKDDIEVVTALVSSLVHRLQERSEQLDAIFALSPDGFVSFDAARTVRYASPRFTALSGLTRDMVQGLEEDVLLFRLLSRCTDRQAIPSMAALRGRGSEPGQRHLVTLAGNPPRVLELALHEGRAGVVSQVLQLHDATRETEVDRLKSEFLSTAAHELRTPMTSIFGFVELLIQRDPPAPRRRDMLARIRRQSQVMTELIDQLLDLSRLEAHGARDFHFEPVLLATLVDQALQTFDAPTHRAPPRVQAVPPDAVVRADSGKMAQALRNLLSNAYKYSPQGGEVLVSVHRRRQPDGCWQLGIAVRDHGIGMTPEQLARVGERFYRADASGTIPGTGLGIGLVREIVTLHGGELTLASQTGEGSTATLWLPEAVATAEAGAPQVAAPALALDREAPASAG